MFLIQATEQQIEEAGGCKKQPEGGGVSAGYKKVMNIVFEYGVNMTQFICNFFLGIQKVARSVLLLCNFTFQETPFTFNRIPFTAKLV